MANSNFNQVHYNTNQASIIRQLKAKGIVKDAQEFISLYASLFRSIYEMNGSVNVLDFTLSVH